MTESSSALDNATQNKQYRIQPQPIVDELRRRGISPRAQEVYWYYYDLARMQRRRSGRWQCQAPLHIVAQRLGVSPDAIKRANRELTDQGLILRIRGPRCADNPFAEAPATTEIRVDERMAQAIERAPDRRRAAPEMASGQATGSPAQTRTERPAKDTPKIPEDHNRSPAPRTNAQSPTAQPAPQAPPATQSRAPEWDRATRATHEQVIAKLRDSDPEGFRHFTHAMLQRDQTHLRQHLAESGTLTPDEQQLLLAGLPEPAPRPRTTRDSEAAIQYHGRQSRPRRSAKAARAEQIALKMLTIAQQLTDEHGADEARAYAEEIGHSLRDGWLAQHSVDKGTNIALKLVRQRKWRRPFGMGANAHPPSGAQAHHPGGSGLHPHGGAQAHQQWNS